MLTIGGVNIGRSAFAKTQCVDGSVLPRRHEPAANPVSFRRSHASKSDNQQRRCDRFTVR
jgi:hypothetical protein